MSGDGGGGGDGGDADEDGVSISGGSGGNVQGGEGDDDLGDDVDPISGAEGANDPTDQSEAEEAAIDQMHAASNPRGDHNDPNLVQIDLEPTPYGQNTGPTESETAAAFRSDTHETPPGSFMEALAEGHSRAAGKYGVVNTVGGLISGLAGLAAAVANAPEDSMAGDATEDPDPTGEQGEIGGFDQQTFDTQAAYDAGNLAKQVERLNPPNVADAPTADTGTSPGTGAGTDTSTGDAAGPTVTPGQATATPGTLLRRRRRTQTILTSPQGVLGGSQPVRRTRSLPRQTLLGG